MPLLQSPNEIVFHWAAIVLAFLCGHGLRLSADRAAAEAVRAHRAEAASRERRLHREPHLDQTGHGDEHGHGDVDVERPPSMRPTVHAVNLGRTGGREVRPELIGVST
ncbi:MAG TPA: hypothetical protein VFX33_12960 [Actinomycetales bacterium]|nr:hypothetical protein [Actinomycetales bacterium]